MSGSSLQYNLMNGCSLTLLIHVLPDHICVLPLCAVSAFLCTDSAYPCTVITYMFAASAFLCIDSAYPCTVITYMFAASAFLWTDSAYPCCLCLSGNCLLLCIHIT